MHNEEDFVGDDPVKENEIFDDTDEDPTFDPHCNIVEPSDEDEQVTNILEDDQVSTHSSEINQNSDGRPKKGRKRKHILQSCSNIKALNNSNLGYYNYKNIKVNLKKFKDNYCTCPFKCSQNISLNKTKESFKNFWKLGEYTAQNAYIATLVHELPVKRRYSHKNSHFRRQYTRKYNLDNTHVCRKMFCETLHISTFRVNTALKKIHGRSPILDQRGLKNGGFNKITEEKLKIIKDQINKIPKYTSHYCREQSSFQYLPPEMTIEKMYAAYKEEENEPVSFSTYKRYFYNCFNLKFKTLKKDTCNTCDSLKVQINNEQNMIKKQELSVKHTEHLNLAENAQASLKIDLDKAKINEHFQCLTYDMEKTLPLPRLPTNIIFYKRQLWLYNTGIFCGKNNQGYCYVWLEGQAGRGAQEVGSCLRKHLKNNLNDSIKELVLWSDSCGGQNRNIKIVLLMKTLFNNTALETITLKYLYPGHSFLPNDRNFSDIESALKHQQRIYTPDDYIHIMMTCKKKNPLKVIKMNKEDFVSSENLEKKITNRKVSVSGDKINWLATRQIKLCRSNPFSIFMNNTLSVDNFIEVNIEKRGRGRQSATVFPAEILLTQLWPDGREINKLKLEDIKSIMHLIPADAHVFYSNLIGNSVINEDVGGYNEALDFEIEND